MLLPYESTFVLYWPQPQPKEANMKLLTLLFILSLSTSSFAESTRIALCPSFEHHGTDLELRMEGNQIVAELFSDGEEVEERKTSALKITKEGHPLDKAPAQSWAIRQAIKGSKDVDQSGVVVVKGKIKGKNILINFNTYSGENFLVFDDYVTALDCK
jgi:hypothetical protein